MPVVAAPAAAAVPGTVPPCPGPAQKGDAAKPGQHLDVGEEEPSDAETLCFGCESPGVEGLRDSDNNDKVGLPGPPPGAHIPAEGLAVHSTVAVQMVMDGVTDPFPEGD